MHSRVYRNLDLPFRIFGLRPIEIILLCALLVLGGEAARALQISGAAPFVLVLFLGAVISSFHRLFGERMAARLARFLRLPRQLSPRLMLPNMKRGSHDLG